ncbi:MAG TPA: acetolactate synthase [Actinomycetales bacterium]|nr:acetolactate synthase [Actinomycetales bacterium]
MTDTVTQKPDDPTSTPADEHGGQAVLRSAVDHGVDTVFTLSGAHVFPVYDAAVTADPPVRLLDVRHEQTAVFAAEGYAKLTRTPGFAVLTAGPGVTNGVSAVTTAWFNGSPLLVLGGRAPDYRWGTGSLQELDQPPLLAPVTKSASTVHDVAQLGRATDDAFTLATSPHRGPVFLDVPMDTLFSRTPVRRPDDGPAGPATSRRVTREPDTDAIARIASRVAAARRPVLVLGSDVWTDGAEEAAADLVGQTGLPVVPNGMARGVLPPSHPSLVTRARSRAFGAADLVVVVGTPLDFRLGYGQFGGKDGAAPADVVHVADAPDQLSTHATLTDQVSGDLSEVLRGLARSLHDGLHADARAWATGLRQTHEAALRVDAELLRSDAEPLHPARIYGELVPRLAEDAVVVGDGGDFVSFAGRFVEPGRPGGWMDPGPYGCLGTGLGYAIAARLARPSSQVVLLLGDGAAGFSLMDVDTLVRHDLPVVMVCGNNSAWGLEKHPMRMLYGYDVVADLGAARYDEVVRALGGAGETVTSPARLGEALDRAFAADVPYLVNVITDAEIPYPRTTTGI